MDPVEPTPRRRVLLVDDHPVFRRGLRALLADEPWVGQLVEAGSVGQMRAAATTDRPDVVALDVGLPDGSGLDAVPDLLRAVPDAAVLLLTMHDEESFVRRALSTGARGYVLKTADPSVLVAALRTVAGGGVVLGPGVAPVFPAASSAPLPEPFDRLTPRQLDIAAGVAAGHPTKQIARRLDISEKTVRNVFSDVLSVTGAGDRVGLALLARERGLWVGADGARSAEDE